MIDKSPSEILEQKELAVIVNEVLEAGLTKNESFVITSYLIDGSTLRSIGNKLQVTPERVAQIRNKALRKIRKNVYQNKYLSEWVISETMWKSIENAGTFNFKWRRGVNR